MPPDQPIPVPDEAFAALDALRSTLEGMLPQGFGLGVGLKEVGGEITDRLALVVYLPRKLPFDEVPDTQVIPTEFLGFETDIVERHWQIVEDGLFYSPVVGGVQVGHSLLTPHPDGSVSSGTATGTLGAIVRRRGNGQLMGLTCCHVARSNEYSPREIMHQPGIGARLGQAREDKIGGPVDCALVDLESRPARFDVATLGPVAGSDRVRLLWQPVKKRGYRTELTFGRVLRFRSGPHSLDTREHGWHFTQTLEDQIEVVSDPPSDPFVQSGDSGSALLTVAVPEFDIRENMVIGLLCATDSVTVPAPDGPPVTNFFALANHIHEVMSVLDVDIAVRPTITSLDPSSALASVGTFGTVTIGGFGFDDSPQVSFGGTQGVVISTGPEQIEVVPPLHFPGTVDVTVSNRYGDQSEPNDASKFTYEEITL
jgi:hypothetical protein